MILNVTKSQLSKAILGISAHYAETKANTYCRGRMYEPIIPKKLASNKK